MKPRPPLVKHHFVFRGSTIRSALIFITVYLPFACDKTTEPAKVQSEPQGARVLLITLDTTRADRIGCYGYDKAQTPAIDEIASAGVRFENAFTQVPLTLPSHATLMTGTYPAVNGVRVNGAAALGSEIPTLAEQFKKRGYRTGAFVSAFVMIKFFGLDRGFDVYDDHLGAGRMGRALPEHAERRGDLTCDEALRWLNQAPDAPFFAWVHLFDPHDPYEPPPPYDESVPDPYDGEIAFADAQVNRLVGWLDEHRLREKTLIVIVGDHGEALGEHREQRHGLFLYDTTTRVPLVMSLPSRLPGKVVVSGAARMIDIAPTVLDVMGWNEPLRMDGHSLAKAWKSASNEFAPVYTETEYPKTSYGWASLRSLTTREWKYIEAPVAELYDRAADPHELTNVIAEHVDVAKGFRDQLAEMESGMVPRGSREVTLDAAARRSLESLGYLTGGGSGDEGPRRDPKDMIDVIDGLAAARRLITSNEDYKGAIELLEPLAQKSPESDSIFRSLAASYLATGRYADAENAFKHSLRTFPSDPERLCGLGDSYFHRRMFEQAIPVYELALKSDPEFAQAHTRLGYIFGQSNRLPEAESHFQRALDIAPAAPVNLCNMANLRMQQGRRADGAGLFKKAIEIDPACIPAHRGLWQAMRMSGIGRAEVVSIRRHALELQPDHAGLMAELAWALATDANATSAQIEEAVRLAAQAVEKAPQSAEFLDVLAAGHAAAGDFDQAVAVAKRALSLAEARRDANLVNQIKSRLAFYESGQAYRE